MSELEIYNVNYKYIDYLRSFPELEHIYTHKYDISTSGGRKYVGVVIENNNFKYFVPLHKGNKEEKSKNIIYFNKEGIRKIKRSRFDIYMIVQDAKGNESLEQVLKCASMIPIDERDLIKYSIKDEPDEIVKMNFQNLYTWLRVESNKNQIVKRCKRIYEIKTSKINKTLSLKHQNYIDADYWLPYPFMEEKLHEWIKLQDGKDKEKTPDS